MAESVIAVIPARFGSSRLPGKALCLIAGRPMIRHVYERVHGAPLVGRVVVATDDERIAESVRAFGGEVIVTCEHSTGTDRVAAVASGLDCEVVLNVQGDLPLLDPEMCRLAAQSLLEDSELKMATVCTPISTSAELNNPNVVKVVRDLDGNALYFSRSPIPFCRHQASGHLAFRHLGVYAYRRSFLLEFARWPRCELEKVEDLEQLRALAAGVRIRVCAVDNAGVEVDTAEDLERARQLIEQGP